MSGCSVVTWNCLFVFLFINYIQKSVVLIFSENICFNFDIPRKSFACPQYFLFWTFLNIILCFEVPPKISCFPRIIHALKVAENLIS